MTIRTRLASPVHWGSRWLLFIGAAEPLPCPRKTSPRTTRTVPGTSVPMIRPQDESPATAFVPRAETHTPVQYRTMITIAVYRPLPASLGSMT